SRAGRRRPVARPSPRGGRQAGRGFDPPGMARPAPPVRVSCTGMSKRSFRIALIAVVSSLVVLAAIAGVLIHKGLQYPDDRHEGEGKLIAVEIRSGMSFPTIARALSDRGLIDRPTWFRMYAMWRGATSSVKSGNYVLRDDLTPKQVLDALLAG